MKEQFLNLTGLTELVGYLKTSIANHKEILPYASNKLFPSVGDINTIYINTATNTIYRWDSSSKTYITLAKAVKSVAISESTENGKITLTVDGNKTTVPVHGLGSAAYTNSSAYSPAGHTHTKAQVGLGNVDNTADANKSVKHATTADSATTAGTATNVSSRKGTADAARHVWFSDSTTETKRAYSDKFKYNPVTNNLTVNVTGNAATASSVAWGDITGKPSTYAPSAHNHNDSTITSLNASKLFGTIDIARLPHGALERLVIVEDDTARFKLTTANIQLGDTVKVTKTEKMYYVVDESKLSSEAGYSVYTAGTATSVPWSGVTEKPSSYPPASHNHDERYYTETEMNSKLAEKATKVHTHTKSEVGLGNVDNTADANKSVKHATTADSATTAGTATNVSSRKGTADAARHVWFSDSTTETKRAYSDKFKYNPVTNNLTVNVTGNAATASSVAWGDITGKPSTYAPSAHNHNDSTITSLNASKLFGTIDIARLPHGALERLVIVEDDTARFKLTTANIQLGDTVKVTKTEKMYYVVDESKLSSEAGYSVYTAGTATSVPWSGVTEKPSSYPPASHNHDERYYTETEMNSKLAEKATKVHTHTKSEVGLGNVDNTADATKSVKYAISAGSASSAAALTSNAGSSTQPVYFSGGKPVACSYTLGKSVPADALFTDHTYGNMKGATSSSAGSAGLVPAPNIGEQLKFLRADGTWVIPTNTTYSVGTTSYSGTTKLYISTGSATDGTMTQNAITTALNGKSATGHTHNYAGSSSAGGNANAAVKLATARKIGSASFDGTADITLSQMGLNVPVEITKADYLAKKKAGTLNANTYYNVIDEYDSANVINDSSVTANSTFSSTKSEKTYAKKSTLVNTTLTASKWTGSSAPYSYVLSVSGVTSSNIVEIDYASNASSAAIEAYQNAMLADGGQTTNQITIKATEKPTVDIPITIVIRNDL